MYSAAAKNNRLGRHKAQAAAQTSIGLGISNTFMGRCKASQISDDTAVTGGSSSQPPRKYLDTSKGLRSKSDTRANSPTCDFRGQPASRPSRHASSWVSAYLSPVS